MNIIAICGSPRRGNTDFALRRFLTKAEELGHKTELVLLNEKRVESCRGCLECEEDGSCKIIDDVKSILERVHRNDLIVFATPSYFSNVSGIMKNFIDRLYVCFKNNCLAEKKMISIVVGNNLKSEDRTVSSLEYLAEDLNMVFIGSLCLEAYKEHDLEQSNEEVEKIENFACEILR